MAADGAQQPLLPGGGGGGEPADAIRRKPPDGVKRFRRCRTAPSSDPAAASEELHPPTPLGNASQTASPKKVLESGRPSPSFRLVGLLLLAYVVAGTTVFYLFMDHMSGHRSGSRVIDALYFCVVTMTTVGYGDLVPSSDTGKLLASAFAFGGVAVVGTSLSKSADYLVEKQESLVFRAVHAANFGKHPARELRAMEMNRTWYKLYAAGALLAASVASGTVVLWKGEGMRPVDALYCVCATVTTLGYGDRSFMSSAGRAFAAVWVTVSTVVVALFFLYVAELYAERRQRALARWVLTRRTTNTDLEAADLDGDRRVGAAEFVLYKLKELGKISQEEIAEFMEEFDELDADHNGTLSPSDLAVAQATA
ncbi:two pore potassium channel b-like [Triticum dicoccoides]|uniref:two pore potassium channel b-like n=1 Tax=Triticum dicoccoides TaxID=85692 RepID=UPI00188ECE4C|nr:two pore potassium channel b-like [Triticum dicoccoides]